MVKRFLTNGFWLMFLAAFIYSIADVFIKILSTSLPITEIAFVRFLFGGVILWPILSSLRTSLRGRHLPYLILRGVFGTFSFLCLLRSMALTSLSISMVLFYTFPIFAALFSFLLIGETIGKKEMVLILMGLIGIYILINPGS